MRDSPAQAGALRNGGHSRDSSVHDKINQFNTMSSSLSLQSKTLERKTADAALKRAMLGREEAEAEMRRYRDEARTLRKQIDEGKDRERRVGERLEAVMVTSCPCLNTMQGSY
jgi:GTP cyclohydrolase FolE2